ncbi:hypothetical protein PIB30_011001 [Stylosanthes scabra]|uniref:TF-B3 domain-containing protein n=1 Tax=Stylosanthes scabra TaxID=79078 RepID=A0ABU6V4T7_9FABA|nr:hypothetical protein [Stylosanthes scabra]
MSNSNNNAILIGPCGGKWEVSIIKKRSRENNEVYYFEHDGWSRFLEENLVQHEDFLDLTYYGGNSNHFKVQIFCTSGYNKAARILRRRAMVSSNPSQQGEA